MEEKARGRGGCSGPPTSTGQMLSDSAQHTNFAFNHDPRPLTLLLNPQLTLLRTPAAAQLIGRASGPKAMLYAVTP